MPVPAHTDATREREGYNMLGRVHRAREGTLCPKGYNLDYLWL